MHIEINAGGLGAGLTIAEYQLNMSGFVSDAEDVISCFKAVSTQTWELNGGVGNLQDALEDISARIREEEEKIASAEAVRKQSNDFLELAIRVDKQVETLVDQHNDAFYRTNPWLQPDVPVEDTPWYRQAWHWVCGVNEAISEGIEAAWNWVADTAKKAWNGLVEFYTENKKIIDTILLVVGAVAAIAAVIASGGGALVFLLGALGCSAGAAAAISGAVAVIAVVSTVAATALNVIDIWAEVDDPSFQAWKKGLNIVSGVSNFVYSIGGIYNSFKGITPEQAKNAMKTVFSGKNAGMRGGQLAGYEYPYLSDAQPGADSAINRELLNDRSRNHFYSYDSPNGGKIIVSADSCDARGIAKLNIDPNEEYIVLSGTHGNKIGGLSFEATNPFDDPLNFFKQDCRTFANYPNVKVINIQDHVASLDEYGRMAVCNRPYLENMLRSGKNIICAWCYSDRSILVHELLGLL